MRLVSLISYACIMLVSLNTAAESSQRNGNLRDLFFGEALYYAYQDDYFSAINRLDAELVQYHSLDEPDLDPLHLNYGAAEFSVGDFEISYRIHKRAGRALKAIIDGQVDQSIRNEAAYRLARIYFRKNQPVNALHVIERIKGQVPESLRVDEVFLRAQIYIAIGRFTDAIKLLRKLENEKSLQGFVDYNLGVALIQNGQEDEGLMQLDKVGRLRSNDASVLAIKDKANLAIGYRLIDNNMPEQATAYLERVRLDGPFSNKALLGAGWVSVAQERYDRALVPWTLLRSRNATNESVQEALLAVPYAYGKLDVYGKSAILYGQAMEVFTNEINRLNASIKSVRRGEFLEAILREEAKQDKYWLLNLRQLTGAPETGYIMEVMASHDFHEAVKNYYDLAELRKHLTKSLNDLDVYKELIELRRRYYEPLLPDIDIQFRKLDTRIKLRIEQRDRLEKRIKYLLISRRPEYLARAEEHYSIESLKRIEAYLSSHPQLVTEQTSHRIKRLKGILHWQVETEYDERLTRAYKIKSILNDVIDNLSEQYAAFIRARQAATQSYSGYDNNLRQLKISYQQALIRLNGIMARQGRVIEVMAINELELRRERLESYRIKARFAMAESYDRATIKQQEESRE